MLWLAASAGFNLYLTIALGASPVFGALGGGLILMTWLYLLCLGLLMGAELNAVRLARRAVGRGAAAGAAVPVAPAASSPVTEQQA